MKPAEIMQMAMAFQQSRILLTAVELDVFTTIGEKGMDAETISVSSGLHPAATERLMNALTGMGMLEKTGGKFTNTSDSLRFLNRHSPAYLSGLSHTNNLWDTWSPLTEVVKTGKAALGTAINERGEKWLKDFIHAMHNRGKKQAPAQIANISLEGVESVLDVGGGSGCYSMEFLNRKPDIKAVVFDLPNVLPVSKQIVDAEGYSNRIDHHEGDFTTDDLPDGFDLVFLSAIIHSNSYEVNGELVKKCYKALNPKGRLVIQDWIMNDAKTEPVQGSMFAINMLVGTEAGDCYSESEIKAWLAEAGFMDYDFRPLDTGLMQVTAQK